ncbi:SDR family NAD(P)-dependent oxidoreductase [Natrialbaceae archaeon GCM10025810]|uniref:SDR family NAD(P)-dependent oxidoreductase n=1 Tax=Halovalidus salilacus TaxID=3075124 RepID=UPI00360C9C1D
MTSQFSVAGQTAVITGGSSGIGRTIAEQFATQGANVVLCSREASRAAEAANGIRETTSYGAVRSVECDVRDRDAVTSLAETAVDSFGGVDILVNNAGANFFLEFADISPNGWRTIVDVNLIGTVNCTQLIGEEMRESGGGSIVNFSSFVTQYPSPQQSHYGAAKAAVSHLTKSVAQEWAADDVRVNAVAPGVVLTPGVDHVLDEPVDGIASRETVDRTIGHPEEIADIVQFLASPAASYLTGEVLTPQGVPQPVNLEDRFP